MFIIQLLSVAAFAEPELPVAQTARPATLPQSTVRINADTVIGVQPGLTSGDLSAGFGIGVTDEFEIGAEVLPLGLTSGVTYGSPSLYGAYAAPIGDGVSLVPQARVFVPVMDGDRALVDAAAELQFQGRDVRVSVIPETSLAFGPDGNVNPSFATPVELTVQPHRRVFLTLDSGVSTDPLDARFNAPREDLDDGLVVPFGGGIGTTLGRVNQPVTDLSLSAFWPRLAQFGDVASTHAEDFAVVAQIQGIIPTDSGALRTGRAR